jgi:hypothetical protein
MTGHTDPRVEIAKIAHRAKVEWIDRHSRDDYGNEDYLAMADALAAADQADRAAGFFRVRVDDETVERCAKAMFTEEQCDRRQKLDVESNWRGRLDDRDRNEYRRLTRAVLAALTGEEA